MQFSRLSILASAAVASAHLNHGSQGLALRGDGALSAVESCVLTSTLLPITITRDGDPIPTSTMTACPEITAVYTTEYLQFCSTGIQTETFTITKTCSAAPCTCEANEVPAGFTVTVATCTTCGVEPVTATITCPSAYATAYAATGAAAGATAATGTAAAPTVGANAGAAAGAGTDVGASSGASFGGSPGAGVNAGASSGQGDYYTAPTTVATSATGKPSIVVVNSGVKTAASVCVGMSFVMAGIFLM